MSAPVRVFVNERAVLVPAGATALDAVRAADPALAERVAAGAAALTDARALPVAADAPVAAGGILRVRPTRPGPGGADADA